MIMSEAAEVERDRPTLELGDLQDISKYKKQKRNGRQGRGLQNN
jgi:hypothetical protein